MALRRRTKSEGNLTLHRPRDDEERSSATNTIIVPPRRRPLDGGSAPAPTTTSTTRPSIAGANDDRWRRSEVLERWNALASRESNPVYRIESSASISRENRHTVADWCYRVVDCLAIDRRVVSVAFSHFDRYSSCDDRREEEAERDDTWLVMLACLQLAIKLHSNKDEASARLINLRIICRLSEQELADAELRICDALQWHLNPPVPVAFLEVATPLVDEIEDNDAEISDNTKTTTSDDVVMLSRFLMELSVYDPPLSAERPSSVAHAAILVAMNHLLDASTGAANGWLAHALEHSSYRTDCCIPRLQRVLAANREKLSPRSPPRSPSSPTNVGGRMYETV